MTKSQVDERHYIITRLAGNTETVLYDYPPALRENALKRFRWLGRHNRKGLICLYRGFRDADGGFHQKDCENVIDYLPWLIKNGYQVIDIDRL